MFFNPDEELDIKVGRNLPHWHQKGKVQYVTFRLADSLPQCVLDYFKAWDRNFRKSHPEPWNVETKNRYLKETNQYKQDSLDRGHGSCVLKDRKMRDFVVEAIFHKDEENYIVWAVVIMPNHVHLLIQLLEDNTLDKILHSIKRFSGYKINKMLHRQGSLWQSESFDRLVRSHEHFKHCINYIRSNPRYLAPDEYFLYIR